MRETYYRCSDCGFADVKPFDKCYECNASIENSDRWKCVKMKDLKEHKVVLSVTSKIVVSVDATSQEEAEDMVHDQMSHGGLTFVEECNGSLDEEAVDWEIA